MQSFWLHPLSFYKRISYLCQGVTKEKKSNMNTIDLNAYRNELAREILSTDDMEVLQSVYRAYQRAVNRVQTHYTNKEKAEEKNSPTQCREAAIPYYTQKELNERINEAEAQINSGETLTCEEADAELKQALPWLK